MQAECESWSSPISGSAVDYRGAALVEVPDREPERIDVDLVGGRERWSVGGQIAEGVRWWRGELAPVSADLSLCEGTLIELVLDNGRTAPAVVEASGPGPAVAIRGLGPPPFEVP